MATYNGQLRSNEIFGAIYNMILGQQVFADNIKGTSSKLLDAAKEDAGLYGDTKLFYFTDVLPTHNWGGDSEATNLLALDRPDAPYCQAITIDVFKQIRVTVDDYLSKRAWSTEGAFAQFTSVMLGWLSDTRKVYEATMYNSMIGSTVTSENGQTVALTAPTAGTGNVDAEATNRLYAQTIAEAVANEFVKLTDINRINDLGYMRSWSYDDLVVVWNSAIVEKIKRVDMPTLFHKEGLIEKFEEVVLPERYFTVNPSANLTFPDWRSATYDVYAAKELDVTYGTGASAKVRHYYPSELIAKSIKNLAGATLTADSYSVNGSSPYTTFAATDIKVEPADGTQTVCKIMHKNSVPLLSAFSTGTSFFNPRSLTENHYLTFGHSTLDYLKGMPFVTITIA